MGQATISTQAIQIAHHTADDGKLRGILLAEECDVGFDDVEQFGDHGGDPAKMAGT